MVLGQKIQCQNLFPDAFKSGNDLMISYLTSIEVSKRDKTSFVACYKGQVEIVKDMIQNQTFQPLDCFSCTCESGNVELVTIMLKLDGTNNNLKQSIVNACKISNYEILELLLPLVTNISELKWELYEGIGCGDLKCIELLLKTFPLQNAVLAAYDYGKKETLQLVLKYNSPLQCKEGVFYIADFHNNLELTIILINYLRIKKRLSILNIDKSLSKICSHGNLTLAPLLFDLAVEMNIVLDLNSYFIKSCRKGNLECANFMIQKGAQSLRDGIHTASNNGHDHVVDYFNRKRKRDKV